MPADARLAVHHDEACLAREQPAGAFERVEDARTAHADHCPAPADGS